jgi:hypothetical protein
LKGDPVHDFVTCSGGPAFIEREIKKASRKKDDAASALEKHIQEIDSLRALGGTQL